MHLTALACGPGGHHLVDGLTRLRHRDAPVDLTVVAGTSEDLTLCGLRFCPDLDALAQTLAPLHPSGGHAVMDHLHSLGMVPDWFRVDDATTARAIARGRLLGAGLTPREVCKRLTADGPAHIGLLPMSDQPVEAHVVLEEEDGPRAVHVLEWVARGGSRPSPSRITAAGLARAHPASGVLDAIRTADAVVLPLTQPVTGVGVALGLPGMRDALRGTSARVIGVSPLLLPRRGDEPATLASMNLSFTSRDVLGLVPDLVEVLLVPEGENVGHPPRGVSVVPVPHEQDADGLAARVFDLAVEGGGRR